MRAIFLLALVVLALSSIIPDVDYGYTLVDAKNEGNVFWWMYGKQDVFSRDSAPLVIWLQGGPGASSMFGDLCEVGPIDACDGVAKARQYSWHKLANLLFVDQPVGTGFSYINRNGYVTTESQIAEQLLLVLRQVYERYPLLQMSPLYVCAESYGGKMASNFGVALANAIEAGAIKSNFKGVCLGDSWISPEDSVASYGSFLTAISHMNFQEAEKADKFAKDIKKALEEKRFTEATTLWSAQQGYISSVTAGINWYNFLLHQDYNTRNLTNYVNTVVRRQFNLTRTWSMSSGEVFYHLEQDFMQSAVDAVDTLLKKNYKVVVYSGQLDLIVDTLGTEMWMAKLKWDGLKEFNNTVKHVVRPGKQDEQAGASNKPQRIYYPGMLLSENDQGIIGDTKIAFLQSYKNLELWTILFAGHMIPQDNDVMAFEMAKRIFQ